MNSFLLFIAGLLVLALSALFAAPYFVDWNEYRDVFEAQATKLIGRSVDVGGDVSLTLLPAPVMRFETINVADNKGNFDTPFAAAKSVTVWLSVPPLLRGTIEARSIEIVQPVVNMRINEDGTGNWTDLGGEAASLPFIPNDVALNSVEISDATVNIWRGNPEPDVSLDAVRGELSSRGLQGPYKFNGQFTLAGQQRELRLSTGKPEEDGQFRFNASVRNPESRDNFTMDGAVRGLGRVPVFKGMFKARLADHGASGKEDEKGKEATSQAPFEIKSDLFAGLTGAQFDNFEMTINKNNKPQTIKGLIDFKFDKGVVLAGTFSSRWIDIDSLLGKKDDKMPGLRAAADDISDELLTRIAGLRSGSLRFFMDQAVLAGDLMTKVQADLNIAEDKLGIANFSARLPGDNRLKVAGILMRGEGGSDFSGPVTIEGKTLPRLLRWAGIETDSDIMAQQGDFSLSGALSVKPDSFQLKEAKGNLFGSAFSGALEFNGGKDGALAINLNSDRMDLARVLGSKASARAFLSLWEGAGGDDKQSPVAWLDTVRTEADVNIGAVTLSGLGETAVDMKIAFDQSSLDIRRLNLVSGQDAAMQAGGRLSGLDGKPEGNITLAVQANSAKGVVGIAEFLEIADIPGSAPERVSALTPVQITAAVKSAETAEAGLDMQIEGSLGKSDLLMKIDLTGQPAEWRKANIVTQASLSNASGIELLRQLRPGLDKPSSDVFQEGAGTVSLEAKGVPGEGLQTEVALDAGGTGVSTQGTYVFGETVNRYTGATSFSAKSTAAGLALLGVHVPEGHGAEAMNVTADIESEGQLHRLGNLNGTIGGSTFNGDLKMDTSGERARITAEIKTAQASLPRLLAPMVSWRAKGLAARDIRGVTQPESFWPESPFNVRFMESVDGKLTLEAEKLAVASGLALTDSKFEGGVSDGRLSVSSLEGQAYGGRVMVRGSLQTRGAGAALELAGEGTGLRLADISKTRDGSSLIDAPGDLKFSVAGEGLTPRGLVSGLSGKGQLTILDGEIKGFSLGAAHAAAIAAQKEKSAGGTDEDALGKRVAEQLSSSSMAFTQIKAPFSVNNGVLEFDKVALSDAEGRVIVATYLQLANMQLDSEWALQSAEGINGSKPRVSLVFTGPLQEFGSMQPSIDTAGLARYVTMQKMQKDVERLERLDVSGPKPKQDAPKPEQPEPPAVAQSNSDATPPAPESPPPGPPPPLPARKKVEQPEPTAAQAPASSEPPPVKPLIPGADSPQQPSATAAQAPASSEPPPVKPLIPGADSPQQPSPAATAAPAPSAEPQPAAKVPEPARKPQQATQPPAAPAPASRPAVTAASAADVPQKLAPLPVRKPPVPRPAPAARRAPPAAAPAQPAQADLPWLQSTNPPAPAPSANTQSPTQLPVPPSTPDQQAAPPPSRPAERFDPFSNSTN